MYFRWSCATLQYQCFQNIEINRAHTLQWLLLFLPAAMELQLSVCFHLLRIFIALGRSTHLSSRVVFNVREKIQIHTNVW